MRLLGAEVIAVESGTQTLKDAMNDAMRDWVASVDHTHYLIGSVAGPHPFPLLVREFQRVISAEARAQLLERCRLPDAVAACVGGGSNALGIFADFIPDRCWPVASRPAVRASRRGGTRPPSRRRDRRAARHADFCAPRRGRANQGIPFHLRRTGLSGRGPEHSWLHQIGRAQYEAITDAEAMDAFRLLSRTEGIVPAIESAHALAGALKLGPRSRTSEAGSGR